MSRKLPVLLFLSILVLMLGITIRASLDRNLFEAGRELMPEPWFQATLIDAYCGFVTFYVWVFYKEGIWWRRVLWFVLIMGLGNIAMAIYVLIQLARHRGDATLENVLLRDRA